MIHTSEKLSIRVLALVALAAAGCSVSAGGQIPCADDSSCPNSFPVCSSGKCIAGTPTAQNSVAVVGPEGHAAADFLSGTVRVIVSARAATGVQSLKLAAGSTEFTLNAGAATPPLFAFDVNTATLADGDASLTATLTAGDGTSATATGTLHVDNAVPAITSFTVASGTSTTITSGRTAVLQASFTASAGASGSILAGGGSASVSSGGSVLVSPDVATTYKLRVTSRSGVTVESGTLAHPDVTVSVVGPVSFSSGSFTVAPSSIQQGASGNFTFTAPNFGSATVSAVVKDGAGVTVGTIAGAGGQVIVSIPVTTTSPAQLAYTLVLSNGASVPDVLSMPLVVPVVPATVAVVTSFDAATTHGTAGDSVNFSITTTGVTGNASVAVACLPTGTVPLSPFTITIGADGKGNANSTLPVNVTSGTSVCTYTATVQNSTGASVTAKTDVTVEPLPTIGPFTFASSGTNAATFAPGSLVTLNHTYNAQGGMATINGLPAGASSTPFNNIQASTVYTLTVTNLAGKQVTSTVTATVSAQISSFSAGATLAGSSGTATITSASTTKLFASFAGSGATGNANAALSCSPSCNATLSSTTIASGGNVTVTGSTNGALTYTLTVTPSSGTPATSTVTVNVVPVAAATSLIAATSVIHQGSFTTLAPLFSFGTSPVVPGTATITGTDGSTYSNVTSGTDVRVAPGSTTTYTLNVFNGAGTAAVTSPTAVVTVTPGTWTALNNTFIDVRGGATVTALVNGKLLVAGGLDNLGAPLASAQICDATGACTSKAMTARAYHTATAITGGANIGKVLLTGGYSAAGPATPVDTADLYDPVGNNFTATSPITTTNPGGIVTDKRARHVAVLLGDGITVLIAGGTNGTVDLNTALKFNTSIEATANVSNAMAQLRASFTGTLLSSGSVLIVGGKTGNLTAELFNPTVGSGTFANTDSLLSGDDKRNHTAVLITGASPNAGKVLISGGLTGATSGTPSATQYLFSVSTSTFTAGPPLAAVRSNHAAAGLPNGVGVLLCGGTSNGSNTLQSCERYDPASGTGTVFPTAAMIEARKDFGLAPMTISSVIEIFAAGGTASAPLDFAETYNPN